MMHFVDIISNIVENYLKTSGAITGILEISPGVYEVTSNDIDELLIDELIITISDTVGFNGSFEVSSVDYDNNTFQIAGSEGVTIPASFGTWITEGVYFYTENLPAFAERISNELLAEYVSRQRFPSLLLIIPFQFSDKLRNREYTITEATFFLFNKTEAARYFDWRHVNTMPYLRLLQERLSEGLESSSQLVGELILNGQELPHYNSPQENALNTPVDAIRLDLSDFIIYNSNC